MRKLPGGLAVKSTRIQQDDMIRCPTFGHCDASRQVREGVLLLLAFTQRGCSMFRRVRFHLPVELVLPRKIEAWLSSNRSLAYQL